MTKLLFQKFFAVECGILGVCSILYAVAALLGWKPVPAAGGTGSRPKTISGKTRRPICSSAYFYAMSPTCRFWIRSNGHFSLLFIWHSSPRSFSASV